MSEKISQNTDPEKRELSSGALPKGTKEKPKKESKKGIKTDKPSMMNQVLELSKKKIDEGFELKDKNARNELNKQIQSELHLSKGWSTDINTAIRKIALEKKLIISDLGFKDDKIGGMTVILKSDSGSSSASQKGGESVTVQQRILTYPQGSIPQGKKGALPFGSTGQPHVQGQPEVQGQLQPEEQKQYMTETAQKKLIHHGLVKMILPLYKAIGIIELDEKELKEEQKLSSSVKMAKEFEELAVELDQYLTENNIRLPAFLNHISIVISIFVVMVLPVIKFKVFTNSTEKKPEYDKDAKAVKVD